MNISSVGSAQLPATTPPPAAVTSTAAGKPVASSPYQAAGSTSSGASAATEASRNSDPAAESQAASREKLAEAVEKANSFMRPINNSIEFTAHEDTGQMVVRVVDQQTKEVIRQIPNEEMVQISKALDKLQGLLIHQKV